MTVNRLLSDAYLWDCEDDFFRAYDIAQGFRQRIHQATDTIKTRNEKIGQYVNELSTCKKEKKALSEKVRRRGFTVWALGIVAALEGALLYITAKP